MTTNYKTAMMLNIARNYYKINFNTSYFELEFAEICKLADIAELCNIKPAYGKSRTRTLYDRLKKENDKLPF